MNFILTSSDQSQNKNYKKIIAVLERMSKTGVIYMGAGHCIGMSDMLKTAFDHIGINSRIVEVTFTGTDINTGDISLVGFNEITKENQVDTHMVVVTETEPPYLVDASITQYFHGHVIVEPVPPLPALGTTNVIVNAEIGNFRITYTEKLPRVTFMHQESIINRIKMDEQIFKSIKHLKTLNYIGISLSVFAVIAVINQIFRWFI